MLNEHNVNDRKSNQSMGYGSTYVNMICSGMPSFSAQWMWANDGGFAMMTSAMNGTFITQDLAPQGMLFRLSLQSQRRKQERQHPSSILDMALVCFSMTSPRIDSIFGMIPGFLTIYAINSAGSPEMLKNSMPYPSTKPLNTAWVARRIRCPNSFSLRARATNGCTSPREPTTCITILSCGHVDESFTVLPFLGLLDSVSECSR